MMNHKTNSLVDELFESLTTGKTLVLNFIYGEKANEREKANDEFIPIDGQQRLTTLFLLHWYVFARSGYYDGLQKLKWFSYKTRDTSRRFCECLCDSSVEFDSEKISEKIKECYWLTGNFLKDPTIKSMLTMLDTIHIKFKDYTDFPSLKDKLIADDCPVSFLWLPMDNFQKTNDLYIKMNARGKLLSDFEIFKAKLQNSDLVKEIIGENASNQDVVLFISKYNNQNAEFFYRIFQNSYDDAMMAFIKEMVRDSYLSYVSSCRVPQKEYRDEYAKIRKMNGNVFFRYIDDGGKSFALCIESRDAIVTGLKNATLLVERFISMKDPLCFENTLTKNYYDEKKIFVDNYQADSLPDDVIRYATYAFLLKFDIPVDDGSKAAYCMWKRFVYNIVTNSDFRGRRENICEAFVFFKNVVNSIVACNEAAVLNTISLIAESSMTADTKYQSREEVSKAFLMKDEAWKKAILDAENYFKDGQIGFLLDCCKKAANSWDILEFDKYVQLYKRFIDEDKKLKSGIDEKLFERALLCMTDTSGNHTAHLMKQPNSTTSWGFLLKNYKVFLANTTEIEKRKILKILLDNLNGVSDYTQKLEDIIAAADQNNYVDEDAWKWPFIKQDLFNKTMGDYKFNNCINLSENRKEVLMLAGTTVRAYSMELNTFLLNKELLARTGKKIKAVLYPTAAMTSPDGFPLRYLEIGNADVGYSYAAENASKPFLYRTASEINNMTLDEVVNIIVNP